MGDVDGRIGVDIHVVEVFGRGILEKLLPKRAKWRSELVRKRKAILSLGFLLFGFAWVCKFGLKRVRTLGLLKVI